MNFTTTKKKVEKQEAFMSPVIMQDKNVFTLNKAAMEELGYTLNTANVNFITNGFDDDNNIIVANVKTDSPYTNNITAKNTFSSSKFAERVKTQFGDGDHILSIEVIEESDGIKYAKLSEYIVIAENEYIEELENASLATDRKDEEVYDAISLNNEEEISTGEIYSIEDMSVMPEPESEAFSENTHPEPVMQTHQKSNSDVIAESLKNW